MTTIRQQLPNNHYAAVQPTSRYAVHDAIHDGYATAAYPPAKPKRHKAISTNPTSTFRHATKERIKANCHPSTHNEARRARVGSQKNPAGRPRLAATAC